jgi:thioredoxin 1
MSKKVFEVNETQFKSEVLESSQVVLVDFWAPWCGPCKQLGPIIDEVAENMSDKVKFVKINIDDSPEVASEYGIRSIPTLMVFKDGQKVETRLGSMSKSALESWLAEVV